MTSYKTVSVQFDVQTVPRLEADAKAMGLSVSAFVRGLYRSYEEAKAQKAKRAAKKKGGDNGHE